MRDGFVDAGGVEELRAAGMTVVRVGRAPVLVLWHEGAFHALDNRCPHMGFPLDKGDVRDGLLDCHWHHARFDVTCGRTLDLWADDVDGYGVVEEAGRVWIDPARPVADPVERGRERLHRGLDDSLGLVVAKAVRRLDVAGAAGEAVAVAARHGALERADGWSPSLSILTAMANVLPVLPETDRHRALSHACREVAGATAGRPRRRPVPALTGTERSQEGLTAWFQETIEVRDERGAERILGALAQSHGTDAALHAVLVACTDHRYTDGGHALDYAAKCAELVEHVEHSERGGQHGDLASLLLTSLVPQLAQMQRMEESSAWRRPVDVAARVADAQARLPGAFTSAGAPLEGAGEEGLVEVLLGDDPDAALEALLDHLDGGVSPVALADAVVAAATWRILRFGSVNEAADWDTVHHTLTYANAVAEAMRRCPSPELFRAVLDGAMSVYLDRFLNVPAARPAPATVEGTPATDKALTKELLGLYDRRSEVDAVSAVAWGWLAHGGAADALLGVLARAVLREDSGFHAFQQLDIAWRQLQRRGPDSPAGQRSLVAAARWLAAHYPTIRGREQTFRIARRLERGVRLHEVGDS